MNKRGNYYTPAKPRKVLVVIGTRPEAIKMLPLVHALRDNPRLEAVIVATGQHPGIVESILATSGFVPDVNLGVGAPGLSLSGLSSAVLKGMQEFCVNQYGSSASAANTSERDFDAFPVACAVHGDTSSAFAAALAAFHLRIPVGHIEAGLRTSSTRSPFPEELNRQLISRIASLHLAPTYVNQENLVREGVRQGQIFISGNTAIDSLLLASREKVPYGEPELEDLEDDESTRVVVVTAHRRENWGSGLQRIGTAIATLAKEYPAARFVLPLHPNPTVEGTLRPLLSELGNVSLVAPMKYMPFARLLARAHLAISDSGGIQEEAPTLGTPVLVVRDTTERQEGVEAGTLKLVGTDVERIVGEARRLLDDPIAHAAMSAVANPYGDGHAAERIVQALEYVVFDRPPPVPYGSGFNRIDVLRAAGFDIDPRSIPLAKKGVEELIVDTPEKLL